MRKERFMCHHLSVFSLVVAIGISGCGAPTHPTSPIAPQTAIVPPAVPQPATQSTYTLSGVVSELTPAGTMPAAGVQLYCDSCGSPDGHTFTSSDDNGFYSFSWARNGVHSLLVWKDGYVVIGPTGMLSDGTAVQNATVDGDTRFDIQIVRR
jgi:hypothetical protein